MIHAKRFCITLFFISSIAGCGLPTIAPVPGHQNDAIECGCRTIFPDRRMQYVHSLTAILPNGDVRVAIGVTTVDPDPDEKTVHCAIMTIEGMVLFEAEYNQKLVIHRSIPPFDSMKFAQNIVNDIRLVFFKPEGTPDEAGRLATDSAICRYHTPDGTTEDIITHANGNWEIQQYNQYKKQTKTVKAFFSDNEKGLDLGNVSPVPSMIEITTHGMLGYSLKLELLEASENPL